jgi:hypothetical protein
MGDPLGMRDDACWECIIRELRKSNQDALANDLRAALDSPIRKHAMSTFEIMNSGWQLSIDPAAQTCRFEGKCQW